MLNTKEPLFMALASLGLIYILALVVGFSSRPAAETQSTLPEESQVEAVAIQPEYDFEFVDVAQEVGIDFTHSAFRWGFSGDPIAMMGGGLCWLDYDNNGWIDLYVVNSYALAEAGQWQSEEGGLPTGALYANDNGKFIDVSEASGTNLPMRGNGCVTADFNMDGWDDIYVTTSRANLMLINQQDGTFVEVAQDSGSYAYGWQTGTSVGDMNGDGLPDLFVPGYVDINNQIEGSVMGFPNTNFGLRDLLFIHQGNDENGLPIFEEVGEQLNLEPAGIDDDAEYEYGLGSLMVDLDQDGDLDIFVANDTNPNRLYLNEPADNEFGFTLVEAGALARVDDINSGMGVSNADFNSDGFLDLFVTNLGQQTHSVYWHDGRAGLPAYIDAAADLGVGEMGVGITGWGTIWADFDNDSDLDLFTVNGHVPMVSEEEKMPILFYGNQSAQGETGTLSLLSEESGLLAVGNMHGRGAAQADFDNDGDLDVAVTQIGGALLLLENRTSGGNQITLVFDQDVAGAMLEATLPNGETLARQVVIGDSYLSSADPRVIIGIGDQAQIAELKITFADGQTEMLPNLSAGERVFVD
ncbi:MAG: CRTAC1 family protein [Chloroflexota bacterium]